ncbi:MAG: YebB family permuted papain-like enzyme [Burkholderiaceae bacterium]
MNIFLKSFFAPAGWLAWAVLPGLLSIASASSELPSGSPTDRAAVAIAPEDLASRVQVGDLVFIRIPALPFRKVAEATGTWTNHVGIVVDVSGPEPIVAEARIPFSTTTAFSRFVGRSEGQHVAVERLNAELTPSERLAIAAAARKRMHVHYDTGFDLQSRGQFCSRLVREVLFEATGIQVGETETFRELLVRAPHADTGFWQLWFFGSIPWGRTTVTPASLLSSEALHSVFEGTVARTEAVPIAGPVSIRASFR